MLYAAGLRGGEQCLPKNTLIYKLGDRYYVGGKAALREVISYNPNSLLEICITKDQATKQAGWYSWDRAIRGLGFNLSYKHTNPNTGNTIFTYHLVPDDGFVSYCKRYPQTSHTCCGVEPSVKFVVSKSDKIWGVGPLLRKIFVKTSLYEDSDKKNELVSNGYTSVSKVICEGEEWELWVGSSYKVKEEGK